MQELIGKQFGAYQVQSHLAKGGMANVFLAHHVETKQLVAIKLVHTNTAEIYERFRRESIALCTLHHDHILPALASDEQDSWCYLVTPYIEGGTLTHWLNHGTLSLEEITEIFAQIVSAIHYAHEQGIVHRDIKSSNVLIRDKHYAYLADFGIAKHISLDPGLTASSVLLGTPEYMAPELAEEDASPRSDTYALGILLYQMLTGQVPYKGNTPIQICLKHIQEQPVKPSVLNPAIPPEVEQVVLHAMAKNPARRYQTAQDFHTAYQQALRRVNARQLKVADAVTLLSITMPGLSQVKRVTRYLLDKTQQQKASPSRRRKQLSNFVASVAVGILLLAFSLLSTSGMDTQHPLPIRLSPQHSIQLAHDRESSNGNSNTNQNTGGNNQVGIMQDYQHSNNGDHGHHGKY